MSLHVLRYTLRRLCQLTATAVLAIVGLAPATAADQTQIGMFIGPPVPVAFTPYTVRVRGASSGAPITVTNITIEVTGQFVDVTFYLDHAFSITAPTVYVGTQVGRPLPPGSYTFRHFARERYFGQGDYSQPGPVRYTTTVIVTPANNVADAIEYYYPPLDHYFLTASAAEIAVLDAGIFPGWSRTRQKISRVYLTDPSVGGIQAPVSPVCRFFGLPSAGLDTHFFSASPAECAAVEAKWPDIWTLETPNAFYVYIPNTADGTCPDLTVPVYRLYNNRADVNHRYTTSTAIRAQMIGAGWLPEGYGADGVAMCAS